MDILIRYLHLFAVLVLAGSLIIENMAIARQISREDLRNLLKVDDPGVLRDIDVPGDVPRN